MTKLQFRHHDSWPPWAHRESITKLLTSSREILSQSQQACRRRQKRRSNEQKSNLGKQRTVSLFRNQKHGMFELQSGFFGAQCKASRHGIFGFGFICTLPYIQGRAKEMSPFLKIPVPGLPGNLACQFTANQPISESLS